MNARQAASIRRGILRARRNANGHVVAAPTSDALERHADATAWQRHLARKGLS